MGFIAWVSIIFLQIFLREVGGGGIGVTCIRGKTVLIWNWEVDKLLHVFLILRLPTGLKGFGIATFFTMEFPATSSDNFSLPRHETSPSVIEADHPLAACSLPGTCK